MAIRDEILILFTSGYPVKKYSEPYLAGEINFIANKFRKVYIVPVCTHDVILYEVPDNVEVVKLCSQPYLSMAKFIRLYTTILQELPKLLRLPRFITKIRYYRALLNNNLNLSIALQTKLNLKELIKNNDVILYSYWFSQIALIPSFIKKKHPSVCFISRGHGFDVFEEQNLNNYIPFRKFQLEQVDKVYSVSKRGMEHLKQKHPKFSDKFNSAYLGTDDFGLAYFDAKLPFTLVTCSIIRNVKRLELMIEILNHLNFDIIWEVIGDGEDLEKLKLINAKAAPHIKINYHGLMSNAAVYAFYKTHSINLFVSLSSSEGLPVSMMEAQSFGIPIMSTDVGGCKEICNNETGFLIDKNFEAKVVAAKMDEFKQSEKNTLEFREKCRLNWSVNFKADLNYTSFAKNITARIL